MNGNFPNLSPSDELSGPTADAVAEPGRPAPPPVRPRRPGRATVIPQPNEIRHIRSLHEAGRNREALAAAEKLGPLAHWAGSEARLVAGDLARSLGAPRLGAVLHLRASRRARSDYDSLAAGLQVLFERRGAWTVWERLRPLNLPEGKQAPFAVHKLWLLRAQAAAAFRDFEAADSLWQRAEKIAPRAPGVQVVRAGMLEREDRFEDGLGAARRALELSPTYALAVAMTAHLLQKLGRDDESLALLGDSALRLESVPLLLQLAALQSALELHCAGLETLDRVSALSPIIEKEGAQWMLGMRVQLAWRCGDVPGAVAAARRIGDAASLEFAARAEELGSKRRRVQLDVPFVAQRHMTCAPATMAALSRFWNQPIDQLEVADEITYGGTSSLRQRRWLEQHGWVARPFTVTWEAACALLERGVPFELSTFEATSGHAQAVCGYDELQQTLLIRDPGFRHLRQVAAEPFLKAYRATGPTGLVVVPPDKTALLEGLVLPDAHLHELAHRLWDALEKHDHASARAAAASLQSEAPEHWLTLRAGLSLAYYDGNTVLVLEHLDRLLRQFPGDPRLVLEKLAGLAEHDQRDERLGLLARVCGQPRPHPTFLLRYAQELGEDAREHAAAVAWVRRAMRLGEVPGGMSCLAGLFWQRGRSEEALEMYRFSTCLAETQENAARQYFNAARHLNRTDQALEFLRGRFERFARKSPDAAVSLCTILHSLGRHKEAREILQRARQLLPENGALDFFAAQAALRSGALEEAEALLQRAQGRVALGSWRRVAARVAEQRGELATALVTWCEIVDAEPHSAEAHSAIVQLLAEGEGRPSALRHLEKACERFPWHVPLHKLWFSWQQTEDLVLAEPIVDRLLELNPRDADSHRQKARILTARGKFDEALAAADLAVRLDPTHPQGHAGRGRVLVRQGQLGAAQEAFRRAVSLAVDYGEYMADLLECCKTMFDRRLALDFIRGELAAHLIYGDGILAFRQLASGHLPPPDLLKSLRQLAAQRPDLWHASAALIRELAAQGKLREALAVAESAMEKLSDSAALWSELASLYRMSGNAQAEIEAREKLLALNPGDTDARCRLADALDRLGQPERATTLLEEALLRQPRLGFARLLLAKVLWRQEKRDVAMEQMKRAIRFAPEYEAAWGILEAWARIRECPGLVLDMARQLTGNRPADPAVWLRLARLQWAANDYDNALASVEKALVLHPRGIEAHELRISILTHMGRFDEALAACRSEAWGGSPPPLLQAREASILYARGEQAAAVKGLQKVLEQTPTLLWGWRLLGSWHQAAGQIPEAEAVARRLLELGSRDADSYFWVAQMKLGANDTPEGVELLERALELNPDHLPARVRLMYVQLGTNQFNALGETLRHLARQGAADWVCVGEISLALRRNDLAAALESLARLCQMPGAEDRAVLNAARAIKEHRAAAPLEKLLRDQLATPASRPFFGALWVEACLKQGRLPRAAEVLARCPSAGLRRCAIQAWLEGINSLPEKRFPSNWLAWLELRRDLRRLAQAGGEWLAKDPDAWGCFGVALNLVHAHRAAAKWFADWRQRPALRSWALHNVMNALVRRGRCAEAIEAGRRALAPASGQPTPDTVWMLAWVEANAGQADQAEKRLRELKPEQGQTLRRICQDVIEAVIRVGRAPAPEKQKVAQSEFGRLRAARDWRGLETWNLVFHRLFRDSLGVLAANGATWRARLWARRVTGRWPWTGGR